MTKLPNLEDLGKDQSQPDSPLNKALSILFEPSHVLHTTLVSRLADRISVNPVKSYSKLIDTALAEIALWAPSLRSQFIAGHPRIGETKKLSGHSMKEQGVQQSPELLQRLAHLNELYELKYPGLVYITFVNGRSRAEIAEEMERKFGFNGSVADVQPVEIGGKDWCDELDRAVGDVGLIAKSRLAGFELP